MEAGVPQARHRPRGGPGQDAPHSEPPRRLEPHDPAAGLHHEQPSTKSVVREPAFQGLEVDSQHRSHVGVHRGGAEALVEPHLGQDLAGERDVHLRQGFLQPRRYRALVRVVGEGEHEPHGDTFHARAAEPGHGPIDGVCIQRFQHRAIAVDALGDRVDPLPGNQRVGGRLLGFVQIRAHPAPHVEHVPKTGGGEQRRARAAARQQGVGGDGASVDDPFGAGQQFSESDAQLHARERQAGQQRTRAVLWIGESLAKQAMTSAGHHQIDEGAANVHAYAVCGFRFSHTRKPCRVDPDPSSPAERGFTQPRAAR